MQLLLLLLFVMDHKKMSTTIWNCLRLTVNIDNQMKIVICVIRDANWNESMHVYTADWTHAHSLSFSVIMAVVVPSSQKRQHNHTMHGRRYNMIMQHYSILNFGCKLLHRVPIDCRMLRANFLASLLRLHFSTNTEANQFNFTVPNKILSIKLLSITKKEFSWMQMQNLPCTNRFPKLKSRFDESKNSKKKSVSEWAKSKYFNKQ